MPRLAAVLLLLAGCSFTFSGDRAPCPPNGWLAGSDIALGAGAAITGAVAAYPCVGPVDQSGAIRAIHCGTFAAGAALGTAFLFSARRGLRERRRCHEAAAPPVVESRSSWASPRYTSTPSSPPRSRSTSRRRPRSFTSPSRR